MQGGGFQKFGIIRTATTEALCFGDSGCLDCTQDIPKALDVDPEPQTLNQIAFCGGGECTTAQEVDGYPHPLPSGLELNPDNARHQPLNRKPLTLNPKTETLNSKS